jgi:ABC-type Fe3+/spermidine/putrescine transport system ATPase subunit
VGTPDELYHRPQSAFVAAFIGQTNLIDGTVVSQEGDVARVETAIGTVTARSAVRPDDRVTLSIRPEQMRVSRNASSNGVNVIRGNISETTFLGEASEHVLSVNGTPLRFIATPPMFQPPAELAVEFDPEDVVVLKE